MILPTVPESEMSDILSKPVVIFPKNYQEGRLILEQQWLEEYKLIFDNWFSVWVELNYTDGFHGRTKKGHKNFVPGSRTEPAIHKWDDDFMKELLGPLDDD